MLPSVQLKEAKVTTFPKLRRHKPDEEATMASTNFSSDGLETKPLLYTPFTRIIYLTGSAHWRQGLRVSCRADEGDFCCCSSFSLLLLCQKNMAAALATPRDSVILEMIITDIGAWRKLQLAVTRARFDDDDDNHIIIVGDRSLKRCLLLRHHHHHHHLHQNHHHASDINCQLSQFLSKEPRLHCSITKFHS